MYGIYAIDIPDLIECALAGTKANDTSLFVCLGKLRYIFHTIDVAAQEVVDSLDDTGHFKEYPGVI